MKTLAIEPATILVVAQCLNQLRHPVTTIFLYDNYFCRNESLRVEKNLTMDILYSTIM